MIWSALTPEPMLQTLIGQWGQCYLLNLERDAVCVRQSKFVVFRCLVKTLPRDSNYFSFLTFAFLAFLCVFK